MYQYYKNFIFSSELLDLMEWAHAIKNDDLESFVRLYEPYAEDIEAIDPIELAIAYEAESIFHHLLEQFDYSEFRNHVDLNILVLLSVLEREEFLLYTLESMLFDSHMMIEFYIYMVDFKDKDYFQAFFEAYPLDEAYAKTLLKESLNNHLIFYYLLEKEPYQSLLFHDDVMYDLICFNPDLLEALDAVEDLSQFIDTPLFTHVVLFDQDDVFRYVLEFLLARGFDLTALNGFGLSLLHVALRHAEKPEYIKLLIEEGADPNQATSMGYFPAHQLVLRDAEFTTGVQQDIDLYKKDSCHLTLQDYDYFERDEGLNMEHIMSVLKCIFNMDEKAIYELSEEEYYHMATMHGIECFNPYLVLAVFESRFHRDRFMHEHSDEHFEVFETAPLEEVFEYRLNFDADKTLRIGLELIDLKDDALHELTCYAKDNNTTINLETEGYDINKNGQFNWVITPKGSVNKSVVLHANLIDVYYVHRYYEMALEKITYQPLNTSRARFFS